MVKTRPQQGVHKTLPDALGSTQIGKRLGFGVPQSAQGFVPMMATVGFEGEPA